MGIIEKVENMFRKKQYKEIDAEDDSPIPKSEWEMNLVGDIGSA